VESKSIPYWINKFPSTNIDFKSWYSCNLMSKICPRKCLDFNWKIFHGQVCTENKLKGMKFSDGKCRLCKTHNENVEHILIDCKCVSEIWFNIEKLLAKVLKKTVILTRFQMIVGFFNKEVIFVIIDLILSIVRWLIWKRRCLQRYENEYMSTFVLNEWIRQELKQHLQVLLKGKHSKYKHMQTLKLVFDNVHTY
jgi:hypothetical protein